MGIPSYIKNIALASLFTLATINFTRTTFEVIESSKRLDDLKDEVSSLEGEKEALNNDLNYKKTDDFIEEEARNKFGFVRDGEEIFVYPQVLSEVSHNVEIEAEDKSNAKLWVEVFF